MMSDDHSDYTWLYPTPLTNAEESAHVIIYWCAAFWMPIVFMFDSPTHFRNEVPRLLARELK